MKWARGRITVAAQELPAVAGEAQRRFAVVIEDDGPGIPEDKAREALKRGKRLDETKPGSGLGLAIVSELVNEYGGKLSLERSELGGLKAIVELRGING
jgi:signal transduction histidine kinase